MLLELAQWLVRADNPLTARVMANRLWQYHFGRGLVATPNDFGVRGIAPTHPELLDHLATRFMQSGWSIKAMHRLIMLSATYQQAGLYSAGSNLSSIANGKPNSDALTTDYAVFERRRLSAEEIRDSILAISGELDQTPGRSHPFPSPVTSAYSQHGPFSAVYVRTKLHASLLRRACRWQTAPLPPDEDRRLRALHDLRVLDTPPEARFDRYTEQASALLDMPVALVSLVDTDRQWFKSAHGIDIAETPRDLSFCAHAILDSRVVFQVPDALDDRRFADNPAVSDDPRVRFYAGAPLELADGSTVGTLCVIDFRPRLLDAGQLDDLRRLARLVVDELETPPGERPRE